MNLEALVGRLSADVVSGAATIARVAADVVRRAVEGSEVDDLPELRSVLSDLVTRILDAQPAMAPLIHLGSRVLLAADEAAELPEARRAVLNAAAAFRERLEGASEDVADRALPLLPSEGRLLTLSASSTVRRALRAAAGEGHRIEVVCLESRPMSEGRHLARGLATEGIPVTYAVDAAGWRIAGECDAILLGADSIGDRGFVNKIGSRSLAAAAAEVGVPLYLLADRTKLVPPGFPQPLDEERPDDEVWKGPPGVRVWNRYFEAVPLDAVTKVVLDDATLPGEDVEELRADLPVPGPMEEWARRHRGPGSNRRSSTGGLRPEAGAR